MTEHPSLMQAAQWKAEYISQTGHISHCTLENECPNDTIKRYGCQNDYPEGRNQVESLVYGTNDVQIAYESLINSPSHVRHLLGLTDFFSGQQYYGVGHADLIFVFITANCH